MAMVLSHQSTKCQEEAQEVMASRVVDSISHLSISKSLVLHMLQQLILRLMPKLQVLLLAQPMELPILVKLHR